MVTEEGSMLLRIWCAFRKNLLGEPPKVISNRGEQCDSKEGCNIRKADKRWEIGSGQTFSCNCNRMKQWNVPCSVKWGMGKGAKLTNILQHSPVAEGKYKSIKYNEE